MLPKFLDPSLPKMTTVRLSCSYVEPGKMKTEYPIMIGGNNFGCGSSREHAPVAMGAAGARVVVAQSYARIFFRNCVATSALPAFNASPVSSQGPKACARTPGKVGKYLAINCKTP